MITVNSGLFGGCPDTVKAVILTDELASLMIGTVNVPESSFNRPSVARDTVSRVRCHVAHNAPRHRRHGHYIPRHRAGHGHGYFGLLRIVGFSGGMA